MPFETRGGLPKILRISVPVAGESRYPPAATKFLQISNEGANALRVYFEEADFDSDVNYIELTAGTGFYEGPAEIGTNPHNTTGRDRLWLRAVTAPTDAVIVYYLRRA